MEILIFKMAAVRHLGFVARVWNTHEEYLVDFVVVKNRMASLQ